MELLSGNKFILVRLRKNGSRARSEIPCVRISARETPNFSCDTLRARRLISLESRVNAKVTNPYLYRRWVVQSRYPTTSQVHRGPRPHIQPPPPERYHHWTSLRSVPVSVCRSFPSGKTGVSVREVSTDVQNKKGEATQESVKNRGQDIPVRDLDARSFVVEGKAPSRRWESPLGRPPGKGRPLLSLPDYSSSLRIPVDSQPILAKVPPPTHWVKSCRFA